MIQYAEKQKRTCLELRDKIHMLELMDKNIPRGIICKQFNISKSTLSKLSKTREEVEANAATHAESRKRVRGPMFPELDKALFDWFVQQQIKGCFPGIGNQLMLEKAREFAQTLGLTGFKSATGDLSSSWIERFKLRHAISFKPGSCPLGEARIMSGEHEYRMDS